MPHIHDAHTRRIHTDGKKITEESTAAAGEKEAEED